MRSLLLNNGLGIHFRECKSINDVYDFFAQNNNKPIIIKPSNLSGSQGVSKINHISDIAQAWQWSNPSEKTTIIAEEFLEGQEFSVETLSFNGQHEIIAITEKMTTDNDHFIEIGHQLPARLTQDVQNEIANVVMHFLNVIEQTTGPVHTEIRYTSEGPKIIESQTRIGGGQIFKMVELVTGVDLVSETVCRILNLNYKRDKGLYNAMAVRMIAYENKQVKAVSNLDNIARLPGIISVECNIKAGDILGKLNSSDARQGYILASGEKVEEAIINANRGLVELTIS